MEREFRRGKRGMSNAGLAAFNIQVHLDEKKKQQYKQERKESEDIKNRKYVQSKILEYLAEGYQEEEIVEQIIKDPIMEKFEYLTKNGVDIRNCIKNWIQSAIKINKRKNEKSR